ncbi:putative ATP-dependent RNA helicase DDX46 [Papilio machaon]|uniref:Putative ATP-dependent RNA helicase DDX46 n=1 Tax=Papilio machaon TaxID=76193 RepID=A0A194R3N6_PAPMA|nr:putative ATP-dependent RNA helicase DDX46 [Papilio machaon]
MIQNQDGLEYSSEEETEDIKDAAATLASKQRKELAKVDHASLQYMPFRKAFYTEHLSICHLAVVSRHVAAAIFAASSDSVGNRVEDE